MKHYQVSAAIIILNGNYLCLQRAESKYDYISKKFEFPGGKIEAGETPIDALIREIKEELNLELNSTTEFLTVNHSYPDFNITLHGFICTCLNFDQIELKEHLSYQLLPVTELIKLDWAAADIPFVKKLTVRKDA